MWRHIHHRLVVGYHGCDHDVVARVLMEGETLSKSLNVWDWLGEGVYFWEHNPSRALEFAKWKQSKGKIKRASVIGAYLNLGRCFDLTDSDATAKLGAFFEDYRESMVATGRGIAVNHLANEAGDMLLRDLDCAVLNLGHEGLDRERANGGYFYQTIRGVFVEGGPAYPGGSIQRQTHVQIAVRDMSCILGYFMPVNADG